MADLLAAALAYHHIGLSLIPCHRRDKRPALHRWKPYQERRPHVAQVRWWFRECSPANAGEHALAIAIITGPVSGNLEVLDFDVPDLYAPWCDRIPPETLDYLTVVQTPSGGYHVYYRSPVVTGNQKLAVDPDKPNGTYTLIETRGAGGYVLAPPSEGYHLIQGDLAAIPVLSDLERDRLLSAARSFSRAAVVKTPSTQHKPARKAPDGVLRPGDDYNQRGDVTELLARHGWQFVRQVGETTYWRRPGKAQGISATFNYGGSRCFYCFSTNAPPLEAERAYSPFSLYATLDFGGDFVAASRALRKAGYGEKA